MFDEPRKIRDTFIRVDVLQDYLLRARASGASFIQSAVVAPWGVRLPADAQLAVHAMIRGDGWLWLDNPAEAIELRAGDVALVRGGRVHHLAHTVGATCDDLVDFQSFDGDGPTPPSSPTHVFLCGAYHFAGEVGNGLLEALPALLHVRPEPGSRLRVTTELLSQELADPLPGQRTVLDRLLDVVLVHLLRVYFDDPSTPAPAWYVGDAHPSLRASLQAMHDHPERSWTVPELAKLASVSRSTFTRVFHDVLGQTAMDYLTEWRMTLARDDLRDGADTLATVAKRYGYASPYAFSAAFTRHHGEPPGRWRRRHQDVLTAAAAG